MANSGRQQNIDLEQLLLEHGRQVPFVQVLRLLRLILIKRAGDPRGYDQVFDFIRCRAELGLDFPGTDVVRVEQIEQKKGALYRVTLAFMGLYGPSSPLPTFYTEDLLEEQREEHSITRDFLDVINQPFFQHCFEIWEKYSILHQLAENRHSQIYDQLFSLLGLGGEHARLALRQSRRFLPYIGLASQAPRSAAGLRTIIAHCLQLQAVEIEQCVHYLAVIAPEQRCSLGRNNHCLGEDAHLGRQLLDMMGKFRICLGPLSGRSLQEVLPDTPAYGLLCECVRFYLDQPLLWDIEVEVAAEDLHTCQPGRAHWGKLGWNTWLFSGEGTPSPGKVPLCGSAG
ncbi:type VI secretion system baseplate subunit TssG [Desulfogranum mediterraneum]|uniref:type VI secretion system baseplate subunit TssG n=1 Tax=Desulfogranum mediterraneum TaxID=160661 RepID=UPI000420DF05|nr:type VI secretion system baseplate subunit TssG [Desulfogranum mediterraneum]